MKHMDGHYECDYCHGVDGSFYSDTGNHVHCQQIGEQTVKVDLTGLEIKALRGSIEEMKTDLARCFMELSECGSESFADDMAVKYFSTWQEIQKRAKGAE